MMHEIPPELAERFKRICPNWAIGLMHNSLDDGFKFHFFLDSNGKLWSLHDPHRCIVGEAHDRNGKNMDNASTACNACRWLSIHLADISSPLWPKFLKQFLDHFVAVHETVVPAQ